MIEIFLIHMTLHDVTFELLRLTMRIIKYKYKSLEVNRMNNVMVVVYVSKAVLFRMNLMRTMTNSIRKYEVN